MLPGFRTDLLIGNEVRFCSIYPEKGECFPGESGCDSEVSVGVHSDDDVQCILALKKADILEGSRCIGFLTGFELLRE